MLDVVFGQASDPGKLRSINEDAMGSFIPKSRQEARSLGWMFVVADGVGGLDFGDIASAKTVSIMAEGFARASPGTSLVSLLQRLVQHANAAVRDEGLQPGRRGKRMATTVVSCALRYDQAIISHVGDSRCYHLRNGNAVSVTRDHTLVNEQRKLGLISEAEAAGSELRHVLTRSLGSEQFVTADTKTLTLKDGDILVLCSDGLYGGLYDEDIARIASQRKDTQEIAEELVAYATEVDGSDNATVQVISIRSVEAMAMYRGRSYYIPGI
jgi:protein phosphatase